VLGPFYLEGMNYSTKASRKHVLGLVLLALVVTARLQHVLERLIPRRDHGIQQLTLEEMEHLEEIEARRKDARDRAHKILAGRLIRPLIFAALCIRYLLGKPLPPRQVAWLACDQERVGNEPL
jgi:hypothetical protein